MTLSPMSMPDQAPPTAPAPLPRILWFLWFQGMEQAPGVVRRCLESWRARNPGWTIHLLTEDNLHEYCPIDFESGGMLQLSRNHRSDLVRVDLLSRFGGVWVDATCLCMQSLDRWLPGYLSSGFFAFRDPGPDRLLSSWFLAADKGHPLVTGLRDEMLQYWGSNRLSNAGKERLVRLLERRLGKSRRRARLWFSPLVSRGLKVYPYFALHYLFAELIENNAECAQLWDRTPRFPADIPHRPIHAGLFRPPSAELRAEIDAGAAPLYKLTWKFSPEQRVPGCTLDYLLEAALPAEGGAGAGVA